MKVACVLGIALIAFLPAGAQTNSYTVTPIVDNSKDSFLVNPWGLSRPVKASLNDGEWWASDNGTGFSTLYYADKSGSQSRAGLVITIPTATGTGTGSPTGTAYNAAIGPGPGANNFAFATQDGTISNWNAGQKPSSGGTGCNECHVTTATVMVNNSNAGASYFGLTEAINATTKKPTFYASNFNAGVEAYDGATFVPLTLSGAFSDPKIPADYKPYGIQSIGSKIWVTFYNGLSGGYVDGFDTNGHLLGRLATGDFSGPWGIALAPANFGAFSNMLLVGNSVSGMIGAYSPTNGTFEGFLEDSTGSPIVIPGLWGISFGNGSVKSGPVNTLYYADGGSAYVTGVFGAITGN
ncbi:MAG TPA: TIGR03118 family protein [Terriglobia bacterium]